MKPSHVFLGDSLMSGVRPMKNPTPRMLCQRVSGGMESPSGRCSPLAAHHS